jgi:lysylphosphatidylglycerol synthetase-like protein (DUF2156 family)
MTEDEKAIKDVLWGMYQEHCTQGRHHETQRATVTNLIIAVAAGVLALLTFDKAINKFDLPLTVFLFMLGLFGAAFSTKHYERWSLHMQRARSYRNKLDALMFDNLINELKRDGDKKHEEEFKEEHKWQLKKIRLHQLWVSLHLLIAALGVGLSLIAIFWPQKAT